MHKKYIDLFSGCGGLALGLHNAGWKGVFAIEKSEDAFKTLEHNLIKRKRHFDWPSWLPKRAHDINDLLKNHKEQLSMYEGIELVAGGPPCQGFSMAGRRRHDDLRNQLTISYLEFVSIVKPKKIFFENVLGFTIDFKTENGDRKKFSTEIEHELASMGYNIESQLVDFSDFGIPQKRTRYILVGTLNTENHFFSELTKIKSDFFKSKGISSKTTLEEAIGDLLKGNGVYPSPDSKDFSAGTYADIQSKYQRLMRKHVITEPDSHRFANHRPETIQKFQFGIDTGLHGSNIAKKLNEKFGGKKHQVKLLDAKSFSPTLTTLTDDYIHYSEARTLSVREYARIQSFPDSFKFLGKYTTGGDKRKTETPRYTQIGNAIPPLFSEISGKCLAKLP